MYIWCCLPGESPSYRAYMARTDKQPAKGTGKVLRLPWRITKIRLWRERKGLTQQQVVDELSEIDPSLARDRNSMSRIETGKQKPDVAVLEAMVRIFDAPHLEAMLNHTPEEALELARIERLSVKDRRRFLRLMDADKDEPLA